MLWEMIKEIVDLGERIYNETPAYLSIDISTGTGSVNIYIMARGFEEDCGYDGLYTLLLSDAQEEFNRRQFEKAKTHMLRLLEEEVNTNDV